MTMTMAMTMKDLARLVEGLANVWHLHFLLDPTFLSPCNYHGRQEVFVKA